MMIGVIGGMGPAATVDFLHRLTALTSADTDQDHLHLIVESNPAIPDRNRALAGIGPSPVPQLVAMARRLHAAGAEALAMPCNTAHAFADAIRLAIEIPLIDMIEESAEALRRESLEPVGLLAADGCLAAKLYQRALTTRGIGAIVPDEVMQRRFMTALYAIKGGARDAAVADAMAVIARSLTERGARRILAACTEVAIVLDAEALDVPMTISTDILARAILRHAGKPA